MVPWGGGGIWLRRCNLWDSRLGDPYSDGSRLLNSGCVRAGAIGTADPSLCVSVSKPLGHVRTDYRIKLLLHASLPKILGSNVQNCMYRIQDLIYKGKLFWSWI